MSTVSPHIVQTDPHASYVAYQDEIDRAWHRVMQNGRYVLGVEVENFEGEFAEYVGVGSAVGTASGTAALELAMRAIGVGVGDQVVTVANTAVATASAIALAGAEPVFVDVDPKSFTIDPDALEDAVRKDRSLATGARIKAVVPVHLYGHPADMVKIDSIARRYGLLVVEDCAQAHGAAIDGRKVGSWGDAAAFSFYPTKNLGCFGDGGAVVTSNEKIAGKCRQLREYGWDNQRKSIALGMNARLDELQAAFLRVKLRHLDTDNDRRRCIADIYDETLQKSHVTLPLVSEGCHHVYHQYVIRAARRDALRRCLAKQGIGTLIHYATPINQHPAFANCTLHNTLDHTSQAADQILSLPIFPQLDIKSVPAVANAINEFCAENNPSS